MTTEQICDTQTIYIDDQIPPIRVGQRCAYCIGSDRYGYQVVRVVDRAEVMVVPFPLGTTTHPPRVFTLRASGAWVEKGQCASKNHGRLRFAGDMDTFIDPSF